MTQRVFVDANVFVSRTCRDWLFHLREVNEGMFQIHTSSEVMVETLAALLKKYPLAGSDQHQRHLSKMEECIDEVVEFPGGLPFTGRDKGDYHVHAAATASRADIILSQNAETDITQTPDEEPYEVLTPDEFFLLVTDSNPHCTLNVTQRQFYYWRDKPGSIPLDKALRKADCPRFAERVRQDLRQIALLE